MTHRKFKAERLSSILLALAFGLASPALAQTTSQEGSFGTEIGTGNVICTGDGDTGRQMPNDDSYARAQLWDQMIFGENNPCRPHPQRVVLDEGTWTQAAAFTSTDTQGRRADFKLYILEDRYSWAFDSAAQIQDQDVNVTFDTFLTRQQFFRRFCNSDHVIGLGAASFEGETAYNNDLAKRRSQTVTGELRAVAPQCESSAQPRLYTLNLGEFAQEVSTGAGLSPGATAPQRRVVIIAADKADPAINLQEALHRGLTRVDASGQRAFREFDVDAYRLFDIASF